MKPNKKQRQAIEAGKKQQQKPEDNFCYACNGTGRYDTTGSPKCGACDGTGKVKR